VTLVGVLSLLTSVGWSASLIMPDILGASLYLCIYLLIFARETLSRGEHWAAVLIAGWSAASHITHWVLGVSLCIFVGLLAAVWRRLLRGRWKGVAEVAGVFLAVALVQMGLNLYLLGEASLTGEQPPFLMARVIADGPGRWYLERHCGREPKFALCAYAHNLPDDADEFLWGKNSIWATAPAETAKQIRAEERTFVWAVLRAYPGAELACALRAAWRQMFAYGLWDLEGNDWLVSQFDQTLTPGRSRYLSSREARTVLPYEFLETVFSWTLLASLAAIVALTLLLWRKVSPRVAGLGVAIGFAVVANAFVTGAVSTVEDRYEARVIWLVPFLAGVLFLAWLNRRTEIRR